MSKIGKGWPAFFGWADKFPFKTVWGGIVVIAALTAGAFRFGLKTGIIWLVCLATAIAAFMGMIWIIGWRIEAAERQDQKKAGDRLAKAKQNEWLKSRTFKGPKQ